MKVSASLRIFRISADNELGAESLQSGSSYRSHSCLLVLQRQGVNPLKPSSLEICSQKISNSGSVLISGARGDNRGDSGCNWHRWPALHIYLPKTTPQVVCSFAFIREFRSILTICLIKTCAQPTLKCGCFFAHKSSGWFFGWIFLWFLGLSHAL